MLAGTLGVLEYHFLKFGLTLGLLKAVKTTIRSVFFRDHLMAPWSR